MKKILLATFIITALSSFTHVSLTEVINALKSGSATEVAKYFDNTVELTVAEKTNSLNKSQAEGTLQDFFNKNQVKSFQVLHQSEKAGSVYCIGNLTTTNGVFRTTIYMKQVDSKQLIQELRFEK